MDFNLDDLDKDQPEDYWKTIGPRADKKEYKNKYEDPVLHVENKRTNSFKIDSISIP